MAVAPGTRLGPYEISSPIGAGGMGEVYRARDTRLDRKVAIKILPAELAADAQLRLRLEREAKTISALNDPHICTLYDVGDNYLVMELLEGETLADRVGRGPLPTEEVLQLGIQIAQALDRAHKQAIVHRDLKPGNVMLTKDGAKLLDFGLAKSRAVVDVGGATVHKSLTQEGTIVGTFQYMAPEQLEGLEADARTDIFAFGAVLYEMASGKRAFEGKTRTSLIAAIVSGRPTPISQVQPLTPPALEHVIERCLEKDPADRWQSAHDIAEELKWISSKGSQAGVAAPITARRRTRERLSWIVNAALIVAAAALTWGIIELRREAPRVLQASILPPEKTQFAFDVAGAPELSPDGKRVVFSARAASGQRMLYARSLSAGAAQPLAGTENANFPFWSPDSRMIGFFAGAKLKKIDASGGPAQMLADAPQGRGGSWSKSGVIVFGGLGGPLFKVSENGGITSPATQLDGARAELFHRRPFFLPDGIHFLYLARRGGVTPTESREIQVGSLNGEFRKRLTTASSSPLYSSSGHLVYMRDRSLVAQKFDAKTFALGDSLVPIAEDVGQDVNRGDAFVSLSTNGLLLYGTGGSGTPSQFIWVDSSGKQLHVSGKPAIYRQLALSHDGRRVATSIDDSVTGQTDIWIEDLQRDAMTRLTFDTTANHFAPVWSPDDSMILYGSDAKGAGDLMMKRTSGTGTDEMLYANRYFKVPTDWSPDGNLIFFMEQNPATSFDIWLYSLADRKARLFLQTPFNEGNARFSPDGRWVVYQSSESGKLDIYVLPVAGNRGKWQISTDGGLKPAWSRDGKHVYYLHESTVMVVDVAARGEEFIAGVPRPLFLTKARVANGVQWEVSGDGTRFLVNTPTEQAESAPLTLIENWTAALKK